MFSFLKKSFRKRSGKASKPSLAVIVLVIIVAVQSYFLIRAYSPATKPAAKAKTATAKKRPPAPVTAPTVPAKKTPMPSVGKIAIVMDDSGYNRRDCDELASIPVPVTISILPQLPFSRQIAECANEQGKEVMLHLPLQPHVVREQYPGAYFITTDLPAADIVKRLNRAIDDIPHLAGINNHEGSKATEDRRVMGTIFKEIQKRDIFFMDSRVTAKSVCDDLAAEMDMAFTGRDVFLDNTNERGYIEGQFRELAEKAKQRGTAVAIGHTRALTWTILKEQVRKLQAQGYEFVTVNDIIRSQSH